MSGATDGGRKAGYHHGDLRAALISEGLAMLETGTVDAISLRAVTRAVGVSATAAYRHFADKQALLAALASEGFRQLADIQEAADRTAGGGAAGFTAAGEAYVRFALERPGLFRLMFTHTPPVTGGAGCEADPQAERARRLLTDSAAALIGARAGAGIGAEDRDGAMFALRAWSLVHGLALLILDGRVVVTPDQVAPLIAPIIPD